MPPAGQPRDRALRDRAERHVFELLPDLPAIERRVLAVLELADADRAVAAAETGLDDTALRFAAKRARKALRRGSAPLAAGARCERAELLLSDRLDAPLRREDRKWLEIHLARCPRCTEHQTLLATARADLRTSFLAVPPAPPALPPAPTPPAPEPAARLRVVPPPAPEPTTPEPETVDEKPTPAPPTPSPPQPQSRAETPAFAKRPSPARNRALKTLALFLVLAGLVAAAIAGISASGGSTPQHAPWDAPNVKEVHPAPLIDQ